MPSDAAFTSQWEHGLDEINRVISILEIPLNDFKAHRSLAWVMLKSSHRKAATDECNAALQSCVSDKDKFTILMLKADILTGQDEEGDGIENKKRAHEFIVDAFELKSSAFPSPISESDSDLLLNSLRTKAEVEDDLEMQEEAKSSLEEAGTLLRYARPGILRQLTTILAKCDKYREYIAKVENADPMDRTYWLAYYTYDPEEHANFQKAAKHVGAEGLAILTEAYKKAIDFLGPEKSGELKLTLAQAYRRVLDDQATSRKILNELLESDTLKDSFGTFFVYMAIQARFEYTELVYEEFASSRSSTHKAVLLEELRRLPQKRLTQAAGIDAWKERSSNTSIALARMLRKMGPATEYCSLMERIFPICYEGLTDETTGNDGTSLRLFAKILALVGLRRDAQIAVSAQFSRLDPDVKDAVEEEDKAKDSTQTDRQNAEQQETASMSAPEQQPPPSTEENSNDSSDDLNPNWSLFCDGCLAKNWSTWADGNLYLCAVCMSVDLCQDCYEKRLAQNGGAPNDSWRTYCGHNHEYIKGPIEGWKGIKNGVMTIGNEKIAFKEWLRAIKEERWVQAWDEFWSGA